MKKVIIIGAGLAGLSCATELVDEGYEVVVLEKNPYLGGRASNSQDRTMHDSIPIGPHVFVTAYSNLRRFFKKIGATNVISWEKQIFLELVYKGQHLQFRKLGLPRKINGLLWYFNYKFSNWIDKLSSLGVAFRLMFFKDDIEKLDDENAYSFLLHNGATKNSIDKQWRFLALSMLNVPLELCSAGELMMLIKHWVTLKKNMMGFAKVGLGDTYTGYAEEYMHKNNGRILRNTHVEKIVFSNGLIDHLVVREGGETKKLTADIYVSTLTPVDLRSLLPEEILFTDFFRNLNAFEGVPYISVNLWFDKKLTHKKFWALLDDSDTPTDINTDFYDQSNIYETRKNTSFITSNIIYSKAYEKMTDGQIVDKTMAELKEAFPSMDATLVHSEVHRTPYIIYAPYPGMRKHKLPPTTPVENFFLAGDWTIRDATQCMESAVKSGYKCAEEILRKDNINKTICDTRSNI